MKKLICFLLSLLLLMSMAGCGAKETASTEPGTEATTEPATEPAAEPSTEPPTLPTEPPPPPQHSGLREDGSFDEGTWFIGDSMTCILVRNYLMPNELIGDANYSAKYGEFITGFFGDTVMDPYYGYKIAYRPEHEGMHFYEIAEDLGEQATAIYIMFGTNFAWDCYAEGYIELVDYLLETCPNATIHLQLIPWGYEKYVKFDTVNEWIWEAYAHYQRNGEERVFLIDTFHAIGRNHDSGFIHLNDQGNENWYNAIVEHARINELVQ